MTYALLRTAIFKTPYAWFMAVEGVDIPAGTALSGVRAQLEGVGFQVSEDGASKGEIRILAINLARWIDRIEQWCVRGT